MVYDFSTIESKWQDRWARENAFAADVDNGKPKYYLFEYPPYPSGSLHVGHVRNYTIGDVIARFKRMRGFNVLYTQGFDSFGLPNEIAAIENNVHPKIWTKKCIKEIKKQFVKLGFSYDTDRFVTYHNEAYYKWTQWLFLLFLKKGLAYKKKAAANWCANCGTVLADDQVSDGKCWRCAGPVETEYLDQWFFAIQAYADQLLSGLDQLTGWPQRIKAAQRNWFGRSEGVEIIFQVESLGEGLPVFTTTPELIYGCTFVALSPDHPLILKLLAAGKLTSAQAAIVKKIQGGSNSSADHRRCFSDGVSLGFAAKNPITGKDCPVFVAGYVQSAYGTGAIFCVPAHDKADHDFAKEHDLPLTKVVESSGGVRNASGYFLPGQEDILVDSGCFSGSTVKAAKTCITEHIVEKGLGREAVHYRLRDWLISRQRYWGPPIPVIYCDSCGTVPVPEEELPVKLPKKVSFDRPGNLLAGCDKFIRCRCYSCGRPAIRETDTMDTFVNSSWFYFKYASPKCADAIFDPAEISYWMPADLAIGGVEHAVTVYIHDRFVTKVLHDAGAIAFDEPFLNLIAHELVIKDGKKMSKSLGNTVDPNEVIAKYGADALRLAILFNAPPEKKLAWKETMLKSCRRFLYNLWSLATRIAEIKADPDASPIELSDRGRALSANMEAIVIEITTDLEKYRFNTCIHSLFRMLGLLSDFEKSGPAAPADQTAVASGLRTILLLLAPFAPHITEELWDRCRFEGRVSEQSWPESRHISAYTIKDLVVQIDGRVEAVLKEVLDGPVDRREITRLALGQAAIVKKLNGLKIAKELLIEEEKYCIFNLVTSESRPASTVTGRL